MARGVNKVILVGNCGQDPDHLARCRPHRRRRTGPDRCHCRVLEYPFRPGRSCFRCTPNLGRLTPAPPLLFAGHCCVDCARAAAHEGRGRHGRTGAGVGGLDVLAELVGQQRLRRGAGLVGPRAARED